MDEETIADICRYVEKLGRSLKRVGVTWYGGEPTLRLDIVRKLSSRLREICHRLGVQYGAGMITNGYLLDELTLEDLDAIALNSVQVTLDGPRDVHSSRRPLRTGGDTYDRIVANVRRIAAAGHRRVSLRVNLDSLNVSSVIPLLLSLRESGLHEYSTATISLAPVHALSSR